MCWKKPSPIKLLDMALTGRERARTWAQLLDWEAITEGGAQSRAGRGEGQRQSRVTRRQVLGQVEGERRGSREVLGRKSASLLIVHTRQ